MGPIYRGKDIKPRYANGTDSNGGQDAGTSGNLGADYDSAFGTEKADKPTQYDYLRDLSAKDLLDKNVMANITNTIAQKNLQTTMDSMGLGNAGYASSALAQTENAYRNALMQNQADYAAALADIGQKELASNEEAQNLRAENIVSQIVSLGDEISAYNFLQSRGFTYNTNTKKWENPNYTQDQIDSINDTFGSIIRETTGQDTNAPDYQGALMSNYGSGQTLDELMTNKVNDWTIKEQFGDELRYIQSQIQNGNIKTGDMLWIERGVGNGALEGGVYYLYLNGRFVPISKAQYESYKGNKQHIKGGKAV